MAPRTLIGPRETTAGAETTDAATVGYVCPAKRRRPPDCVHLPPASSGNGYRQVGRRRTPPPLPSRTPPRPAPPPLRAPVSTRRLGKRRRGASRPAGAPWTSAETGQQQPRRHCSATDIRHWTVDAGQWTTLDSGPVDTAAPRSPVPDNRQWPVASSEDDNRGARQ